MRKHGKKYRKISAQLMGDRPITSKEDSFSNIFCRKEEIRNFRNKRSEVAHRSCSRKKSAKKMDHEDEKNLEKRCLSSKDRSPLSWFEKNGFFEFSSCKTSVAFFVPLDGFSCDIGKNSRQKLVDWNDLFFYECSNATAWSHYKFRNKIEDIFVLKQNFLPEFKFRRRSLSESSTNSEDSFICFENISDVYERDHDFDTVQCSTFGSSRKMSSSPGVSAESEPSLKPSRRKKKVRFMDSPKLVTVHVIIAWDYAYRAARVSQWEVVARDSNRFKLKIKSLEPILSPVFNPEHRAKVWKRLHDI